ncbi:hypothetical protein pb186bvf_004018 [Paramecium bursaria]
MFPKLFRRVLIVNIQGELKSSLTRQIQTGLDSVSKFTDVQLIAVHIDSKGQSNVQAKQITNALKKYSNQTGAPLYCFAGAHVLNSANIILTSGNKVFASQYSQLGDFGFTYDMYNAKEFIDKSGIQNLNLAQGAHKIRLNSLQSVKEEDLKWKLDYLYEKELDLKEQITLNRQDKFQEAGLSNDQVSKIFDNHNISVKDAIKYKYLFLLDRLVDQIGNIDQIVDQLYHGVKHQEIIQYKQRDLATFLFKYVSL